MAIKRNYYLVLKAVEELKHIEPMENIIDTIFAGDDMQLHLKFKFKESMQYEKNFMFALLAFYEKVDITYQLKFDNWINARVDKIHKDTLPYLSDLIGVFDEDMAGEVIVENIFNLSLDSMNEICEGAGCKMEVLEGNLIKFTTTNKFFMYNLAHRLAPFFPIKSE